MDGGEKRERGGMNGETAQSRDGEGRFHGFQQRPACSLVTISNQIERKIYHLWASLSSPNKVDYLDRVTIL